MNRRKVVLGTSNRPTPTREYVRGPYKKRAPPKSNEPPKRRREVLPESEFKLDSLPTKYTPKGVNIFLGVQAEKGTETPDEQDEKILAQWRQLDNTRRRQIYARMSFELQNTSSTEDARTIDLWSFAVYSALRDALGPSSGAGHGEHVVRRLMGASAAWQPVAEFITNGRIDNLRPAEQLAVFGLLAKLLVARAKRVAQRADIPLTPKLVAQNTQHIAGVFDNAFPGYLANGLIGSVSRMLIAQQKPTTQRVRMEVEE